MVKQFSLTYRWDPKKYYDAGQIGSESSGTEGLLHTH